MGREGKGVGANERRKRVDRKGAGMNGGNKCWMPPPVLLLETGVNRAT